MVNEWPLRRKLAITILIIGTVGGSLWTFLAWLHGIPQYSTCRLLHFAAEPGRYAVPILFGLLHFELTLAALKSSGGLPLPRWLVLLVAASWFASGHVWWPF